MGGAEGGKRGEGGRNRRKEGRRERSRMRVEEEGKGEWR